MYIHSILATLVNALEEGTSLTPSNVHTFRIEQPVPLNLSVVEELLHLCIELSVPSSLYQGVEWLQILSSQVRCCLQSPSQTHTHKHTTDV